MIRFSDDFIASVHAGWNDDREVLDAAWKEALRLYSKPVESDGMIDLAREMGLCLGRHRPGTPDAYAEAFRTLMRDRGAIPVSKTFAAAVREAWEYEYLVLDLSWREALRLHGKPPRLPSYPFRLAQAVGMHLGLHRSGTPDQYLAAFRLIMQDHFGS